jgi:alpha/beta superfamily hydrolase
MSLVAEHITVEGSAGPLQVIAEDPGTADSSYAVVCHPHPLYGGTMDNKVVTTVARALQATGIPTLRFNFRGVGASAGEFDRGVGETADADAVAAWGARRWPGRTLVLAGFSFGGGVALRVAQRRETRQLITVAPAIEQFDAAMPIPSPWWIIQGDADDVVDPQSLIDWVNGLEPKPRLVVMRGVGHFFHGHLHELRDAVIEAMRNG